MSTIAPLSGSDAEQLHGLLQGVNTAAKRMHDLIAVFPGEIDASQFSTTVDGDEQCPPKGSATVSEEDTGSKLEQVHDDLSVLQLAYAHEQGTGWHRRRPVFDA